MLSSVTSLPIVILYSKLVDSVPERRYVLYAVFGVFSVAFFVLAGVLAHPALGIANEVASPDRYTGWVAFLVIETFGSIAYSAFWSFVADSMTPDLAKKGFAFITTAGQVGSVVGPLVAGGIVRALPLPVGVPLMFG
eukprot:CAMPEP_0119152062 /NCGR_PEP_ID=MMETSP1310-20130426/47210_1 /TAXON_ID=464262 /ORGANISM="Genus nov. species nov., Strain RCC2339" /LENGTH=136 /DNA_ID=CAMNT_0007144395 /DNA_START=261 /DNA_END=668 /DNA_ORIENTATION=+